MYEKSKENGKSKEKGNGFRSVLLNFSRNIFHKRFSGALKFVFEDYYQ
jgi:hypothetical protein